MFSEVHSRVTKTGQAPGTATYTGKKKFTPPNIAVITYDTDNFYESKGDHLAEQMFANPGSNTWVSVEGLSDPSIIQQLATRFNLHPLTVEDILNVEQRPKVEEFDNYIFVTMKVLQWRAKSSNFTVNQISLVLGNHFVLSFQESDTTLFDPIVDRIRTSNKQRFREQTSDYLAYRLIDTVIDEYFVVLEMIGDEIEKLEESIIINPSPQSARNIYHLKRQMLLLRKAIWPMREAINHLSHTDEYISKATRIYLRDVYDHTMQAIDTLETSREMLSGMLDMYLSGLTIRMNEIMKTLTIITTIFIPITAIASIYGMNFTNLPGIHTESGYEVAIGAMIIMALSMLIYFRKKKWI